MKKIVKVQQNNMLFKMKIIELKNKKRNYKYLRGFIRVKIKSDSISVYENNIIHTI